MKVYKELDLATFEAWSGAVETLETIKEHEKIEDLECMLEDIYPDGIGETLLNDILWFDSEDLFETLGIEAEDL